MRGIVLAAGGGVRLRPLTDELPKTLLAVDGERTIFELALENLRRVDVVDITVVTGHCAEAITDRTPELERRYGISVQPLFNPRYAEWNNAYSLWLARDVFAAGALVVNGDTVHPASVEERLLEARGTAPLLLAIDDLKSLGEEEMKVHLDEHGRLRRVNKALDPEAAQGEYIGVSLVESQAARDLASALEATFERDTGLYYEDGYQEFADRGGVVGTASIGPVDWVEVDNHDDLARARELRCPS